MKKNILSFITIVMLISSNAYASEQDTFNIARESYEQHLYPTSSRLFKSFIDFYPESEYKYEAYLYIAKSAFYSQKYSEADRYLDLLSKTDLYPQERSFLWGLIKIELSDFTKAKELFEHVRSYEYDKNQLYFKAGLMLGNINVRSGNRGIAEEFLNEVIIDSNDRELKTKAYSSLAKLFFYLYDNKALKRILKLWEGDLDTLEETALRNYYRAKCYLREDNEFDAFLLLKQALNYVTDVDLKDKIYYDLSSMESNIKRQELNLNSISKKELRNLWKIENVSIEDISLSEKIRMCDVLLQASGNSEYLPKVTVLFAELLYEAGRLNDAISNFNKYITDTNKQFDLELNYRASYGLGLAYLKKKDYQRSFDIFDSLKRTEVLPELRTALMLAATQKYEEEERYAETMRIYDEILSDKKSVPYHDYVLLKMAYVQLQTGEYNGVIDFLNKLDELYPLNPYREESLYYRSIAYYELAENELSDEFIESFKKLFVKSEYLTDLLKLQVRVKASRNDIEFNDLTSFYDDLLKIDLTDVERNGLIFEQALGYLSRDELDKALELLLPLVEIELFDMRETAMYYIATIYYQRDEVSQAIESYEKLLQDYEQGKYSMEVRYALAQIYIYLKDYSKAESLLFKNIRLKNEEQIFNSALLLKDMFVEQLRFTSAHQLFDQLALRFPHKSSFCLEHKLDVAFSKGDWQKVIILGNEIMTVGSVSDGIVYKLASAQERINNYKEAISLYNDIVYTRAASKEFIVKAYLQLAKLYERTNMIDKSIDYYQRLVDLDEEISDYAHEQLSRLKKTDSNS